MNWALVIGGIIAVAVIGIIVYFVVFRKAGLGIFGGTASSQSSLPPWNPTPTGPTSISVPDTPEKWLQTYGSFGYEPGNPSQKYIYQPPGSHYYSDPSKIGYESPHGF